MTFSQPTHIPNSPDQISTSLVEGVLRKAGKVGDSTRIESLEFADLKYTGMVGSVARIHLEYADADAGGPRSMIMKFPSTGFPQSLVFGAIETRFYQQQALLAPSVRTPEAYYLGFDEKAMCLLLEDLGDYGFVRQIDGCDRGQATLAIRQLTKLHGTWWNRALPADLSWIQTPSESQITAFCRHWLTSYQGEWPEVLEKFAPMLIAGYEGLAARLSSAPQTLVHGDFHSQNISFGESGTPDSFRFIDFQFVQHATGMFDVARFLATSLGTDVRRSIEWELLRGYHAGLAEQGVVDYDFDRSVDDFRAALLWNLATPIALHVLGIETAGQKWPERLPMIERCLTAITDWHALDLL